MSIFLNYNEKEAVRSVVKEGEVWGYGNMISRLQKAWVLHLLETYKDFTVMSACLGAGMSKEYAKSYSKNKREDIISAFREITGMEPT
jgi:hypothetical protein